MLLELLLVLPVLLYAWHWWARGYWRRRNVFQIDGEFIFGSTGRALFSKVSQFSSIYDGIYRDHKEKKLIGIYSFFKPLLVVTDIDYIQQILITDFNSFPMAGVHLGNLDKLTQFIPLMHSGEQWRTYRGILAQSLSSAKLNEYLPLMIKSGQSMVKYIQENVSKPIKVSDLLKMYLMNNTNSAMFGLEPMVFEDQDNEFRKHVFDTVYDKKFLMTYHIGNYAPFLNTLLRHRYLSKEAEDFFISIASKIFDFRMKNNVSKNDLIDQLIKIDQKRLSEGKKGMETVEVAGHMATTHINAVNTTSVFISQLFLELAKRPEVQERLREEILAVGKEPEDFDSDKIRSLEYLNMVLNEVLRIHYLLSYYTRYCTKDTMLGDLKVEKGTRVIIPYSAIVSDPEYYPEPEKFIPERFSPSNISQLKGKYYPFGGGPKQCVGMRYATLQLKLACIVLLQKYKLSIAKEAVDDNVSLNDSIIFERV